MQKNTPQQKHSFNQPNEITAASIKDAREGKYVGEPLDPTNAETLLKSTGLWIASNYANKIKRPSLYAKSKGRLILFAPINNPAPKIRCDRRLVRLLRASSAWQA